MKRNILHVIASNFIGGPEKQILHHAQDMAGSPYEISIASFQDNATTPEIVCAARAFGIRAATLRGGIRLAALIDLIQLLRRDAPAVLCTHGYKANILGRLASYVTGTAHVAFVRGWTAETWKVALYEKIDRMLLSRAPWIVCVSARQVDQLVSDRNGLNAPRVIPNAILPSTLEPLRELRMTRAMLKIPEGAFVFGSVGRLSVEKGHTYLIEAFADLCHARPETNAFLVLLGDGREMAALKQQAVNAGIRDKVMFAGFRKDCAQWLTLLDCIVQPSLTEGTPNSLLEALLAHVPVIATEVGGVPDLITDSKSGLLVPPGNAKAMLAAMLRLTESGELRLALSAALDSVDAHYLPDTQRASLMQLYDDVIQKNGSGLKRGARS